MHIGSIKEYIEIFEQERLLDDSPASGDVRVNVTVRLMDFSGSYEHVWIEKAELENFLSAFSELTKSQTGKARINSISPDEFWAEFRAIGRTGKFEVEVQLKRFQHSGRTYWPTSVAGGFALDPVFLPIIEKGFKELMG